MKRALLLLVLISGLAQAQNLPRLADVMPSSTPTQLTVADGRITDLIKVLSSDHHKSELDYLKKIFKKTERTFLLEYDPYSEFSQIFKNGKFDCLTATTLFSMVLDELHVSYRIIETDYHIFLLLPTSKGDVLFETTDRMGGFVTRPEEIAARIASYQAIDPTASAEGKVAYHYQHSSFHDLNPTQLSGLLYFNQCVKAYNEGAYQKCADLLEKAQAHYHSPRVDELTTILLHTVESGKLSAPVQQYLLDKIRLLSAMKGTQIASR